MVILKNSAIGEGPRGAGGGCSPPVRIQIIFFGQKFRVKGTWFESWGRIFDFSILTANGKNRGYLKILVILKNSAIGAEARRLGGL